VVAAEDEVKTTEFEAHTSDEEVLTLDADGDITGDPLATQAVAVGDGDLELLPPPGERPRQCMVTPRRKLWVEPVSSRDSRRLPFTITRRSMVFSVQIPAKAWRETTKALAFGGSWAADFSSGSAAATASSLARPASFAT
jgi:hypothetical protein